MRVETAGQDQLASLHQPSSNKGDRIKKSSFYALFVITLANAFNYLDRNIISILAENIKSDLSLDDAQMGFLLGTSFAVFYSIIGLAMGNVADRVRRKYVMSLGIAIWSGMTMLGGAANSFLTLSLARFGVGVGEATTNPCAHSLLTQVFPQRRWSLAIGTYMSSAFLGGGAAMIIGGYFLQYWGSTCSSVPISGACNLAPWKATLLAVGFPGLLVALLMLTIREPDRETEMTRGASAFVFREVFAALPGFSLESIRRSGGGRAAFLNIRIGAIIAVTAAALAITTGDIMQWSALGIGAYAIATWAQRYYLRDRPLYNVTFGDRTFILTVLSITLLGCITGTAAFWSAPFAMRKFDLPALQIGASLAAVHTLAAVGGILVGGWINDRWKMTSAKAPAILPAMVLVGLVPTLLLMILAEDFELFLLGYLLLGTLSSLSSGGFHALIQELVLPRMRGSASSCQALISIIFIFGTGPYFAGKISTVTGSLSAGLLSLLIIVPLALYTLWRLSLLLNDVTEEKRMAIAMEPKVAAVEPKTPNGAT